MAFNGKLLCIILEEEMVEKEKKSLKILSRKRESAGKGSVRQLRRSGFIPAVVYGAGEENKLVCVERKAVQKVLSHAAHNIMADLVIEDGNSKEEIKTIIKEIQINPITQEILHIDFYHIGKNLPVRIAVPIKLVGESQGVKEGGILEQELREIEVEGLPDAIPEEIEVDITELKTGDSIYVKDIKVPEGIRLHISPEHLVATILAPKAAPEEAPAEAAAPEEIQPKVITQEIAEERRKEREAKKEAEKGS